MNLDPHQPGDPAPFRSLDAETFNELIIGWLEAPTSFAAELSLRTVYETVAQVRPVFDSLMIRAHQDVESTVAASAAAFELLWKTAEAMAWVAHSVEDLYGDRADGYELFATMMREAINNMLTDAAADAVDGELAAIGALLEADRLAEAIEAGLLGTLSLVMVLLGDGRTEVARRSLWPQPVMARREHAVKIALAMSETEVRDLLAAQARLLTSLRRELPKDRWRAMVKRPERGSDRIAARPGAGFVGDRELAEWSGNPVKVVRAKISRTLSKCSVDYADRSKPYDRVVTPRFRTAPWVRRYLEGQ